MVATIGSLVQETKNFRKWLIAATLYAFALISTSVLLGIALSATGYAVRDAISRVSLPAPLETALPASIIGVLAIAYAVSDLGLIWMPRPILMQAVPVTWWRRWQPYGASFLYGAVLGLGVTTRIPFGAYYVLCSLCLLKGSIIYGALLMGVYGAARALVIFPATWVFASDSCSIQDFVSRPILDARRTQYIVAFALIAFGGQALGSSILMF